MIRVTETFRENAPEIIFDLRRTFHCSQEDGAAIVGNGGRESGGFEFMHQIGDDNPGAGVGIWQWSGARHAQFIMFCRNEKLPETSIVASVRFLIHELQTTQRLALRKTMEAGSLYGKVVAFEGYFERAGVPALAERYQWAQAAMGLKVATRGIIYTA